MTWEDQVADTRIGRPHLVILGAGASRAAFPNGDRNGRHLPLMNDLVDVVGLGETLEGYGLPRDVPDFEALYSELARDESKTKLRAELESAIRHYFASLELPDHPTVYDLLILALRPKDLIATFNWDPFLWDAWMRNRYRAPTPHVAFLHGSVSVGYCEAHTQRGPSGRTCPDCHEPLAPSPLLYPVAEKDYASNPFLAGQWGGVQEVLKRAWMVTVFGYGAPRTDVEALRLFSTAWGAPETRNLEEFEFIDVADEDVLRQRWSAFLFSHHWRVATSFDESWLARHPRRSGEAMWGQLMDARWVRETNGYAALSSFDAIDDRLEPLLEVEAGRANYSNGPTS